jgi:Ohr subfamily peroxiredoxin
MKTLYTATAIATGSGRAGHVRTSDNVLDLDLSVPKEMGGEGEAATNPEQLFAAGYSACFHSALIAVARRAKVELTGTSVLAEVSIGPIGHGGYGLAVALVVDVPGVDPEQAEALLAAAHQVCPYSNATRGNIDVTVTLA